METTNGGAPRRYRITIRGGIPERYASMFEDLTTEPGAGVTTLVGDLVDQAQLYGVLDRLRTLGVELVSITEEPG